MALFIRLHHATGTESGFLPLLKSMMPLLTLGMTVTTFPAILAVIIFLKQTQYMSLSALAMGQRGSSSSIFNLNRQIQK